MGCSAAATVRRALARRRDRASRTAPRVIPASAVARGTRNSVRAEAGGTPPCDCCRRSRSGACARGGQRLGLGRVGREAHERLGRDDPAAEAAGRRGRDPSTPLIRSPRCTYFAANLLQFGLAQFPRAAGGDRLLRHRVVGAQADMDVLCERNPRAGSGARAASTSTSKSPCARIMPLLRAGDPAVARRSRRSARAGPATSRRSSSATTTGAGSSRTCGSGAAPSSASCGSRSSTPIRFATITVPRGRRAGAHDRAARRPRRRRERHGDLGDRRDRRPSPTRADCATCGSRGTRAARAAMARARDGAGAALRRRDGHWRTGDQVERLGRLGRRRLVHHVHDDLVAELGHLPWLDTLIEPSFDVL